MTWLQNLTLGALAVASLFDALNNANSEAVMSVRLAALDARLAALEVSCVVDR